MALQGADGRASIPAGIVTVLGVDLGVVLPQSEIGDDPIVIKDFVQTAEGLGYSHVIAYDHVLGANPERPGGWTGFYDKDDAFHEPFVLFGFLAGVTTTIELVTAVIILPQRQTALVAKQAAEVDILSGGRLRLGVGTGWNEVEYEALGQDFRSRGKRQAEQVDLLRKLWEDDTVDFSGEYHRIDRASILPRPKRRIPIWFGGTAEAVLKRAARWGDGWFPMMPPGDGLDAALQRLDGYLAANGRDRSSFGIDGMVNYVAGEPERWHRQVQSWADRGAGYVNLRTMRMGFSPAQHIAALSDYRRAFD